VSAWQDLVGNGKLFEFIGWVLGHMYCIRTGCRFSPDVVFVWQNTGFAEPDAVPIMLWTRIREVFGSNLGRKPAILTDKLKGIWKEAVVK
jgi:hypothetical protein